MLSDAWFVALFAFFLLVVLFVAMRMFLARVGPL